MIKEQFRPWFTYDCWDGKRKIPFWSIIEISEKKHCIEIKFSTGSEKINYLAGYDAERFIEEYEQYLLTKERQTIITLSLVTQP